jgi:DNA topoisomerase-1
MSAVMNEAAAEIVPAGLIYVSDDRPGIRRLRRGDGFAYRKPDGKALRDEEQLRRIRKLAIPPAYSDVWICPSPRGHLQATGRDARGRKQYRYHADWRMARDESKFERMQEFGAALPRIRARVTRDLAAPVGQRVLRDTVIAAIVRLLDTTLVRVGNDEYAFQYLDDEGETRSIGSADVNDYLREASGGEFTAKDFRTWHGSVHALKLWRAQAPEDARKPTLAGSKRLLAEVAARLGNTVAVCRKAYVHPRVLALMTGEMKAEIGEALPEAPPRKTGLSIDERMFLAFLGACG